MPPHLARGAPAAPIDPAFALLGEPEIALLTTFRPSGEAVATPVGVAFAAGKAYFMALPTSGKIRRIARDPRVTLAACTRPGVPRSPAVAGVARRLDGAEAEHARAVLAEMFYGRLWLASARYRGEQPVACEISPPGGLGCSTADGRFGGAEPPVDAQSAGSPRRTELAAPGDRRSRERSAGGDR